MAVCWGCKDDESTTLSLNADSLIFPYNGGTQTLTISSNTKWGISKLPEWISASVASGTGAVDVTLTAKANSEKTDRDGFAVIYSDDGQQTLVVGIKQLGTHSSPIILDNTEEKVFGGRVSTWWNYYYGIYEDAITITCDTEWEIEGPSWVTVYYNNEEIVMTAKSRQEGSGSIGLAVNEVYTGEVARRDTIYLRTITGESVAKVPVCQLGKNDVHCIRPITSSEGFMCYFKTGSNVESIVAMVYADGQQPGSLTYSDFNNWYASNGDIPADVGDGTYFIKYYYFPLAFGSELFQRDTDYIIYMLGADANNYYVPLSNICQFTFHTLNDVEIRPRVEISDVKYANGHLQWTVTPNDYTSMYLTNTFNKTILQLMGIDTPQKLALELAYGYNYGDFPAFYSDISKTFSVDVDVDDLIIAAVPLGPSYKPSMVSIYDFSSGANVPENEWVNILNQ